MTERIVDDPSQYGWVEKNGKWVWKGSGSVGAKSLNDLDDVFAESPNKDDLIVFNGDDWISGAAPLIESEITYQGGYDLSSTAPSNPNDGDLYVNNTDGVVDSSWGSIAGTSVLAGNVVAYSEAKGRWYLLGDLSSTAVTSVSSGTGISVDSSSPKSPSVSVVFGTAAGQVAQGNHNHDGVYLKSFTETDPVFKSSPAGGITQADIDKWNNPPSGGGGTWSPRGDREVYLRSNSLVGSDLSAGQRKLFHTITGPLAIEYSYTHVGTQSNISRSGHILLIIDGKEWRRLSDNGAGQYNSLTVNEKASVSIPLLYADKVEFWVVAEKGLISSDGVNITFHYWPI